MGKEVVRIDKRRGRRPVFTQNGGEFRRGGQPNRNRGTRAREITAQIGDMNGKMIRKGKRIIITTLRDLEVSGMERNRNRSRQSGIVKKENRKEKTIDTRGPGERGNWVIGNMVEGVAIMKRVK